jgi:integrase
MVMNFVVYLRDVRKVSRSSIRVHCAALSHFFYMIRDDDSSLDWTKVRMEFLPDERIRRDRAYTVEEIQKMLSVCSRTRDKVIILLMESTGMRIGGIHTLKIGDLIPKTTPQGKIYRIEVYSGSASAHYFCYCNVETANAIDEYLQQERRSKGEILQNDTPLIRDLKSLNVKKVKPLTIYNIRYIVNKIVEKSGIRDTFQFTGEAKRSKGFRKFYKTQAESSGMKPVHVELTHGHSIGISGHYYRPAESDILEDYMTHAADSLTIDPTKKLQKKVQELESEQAQEIDRLRAELKEWEPVKAEIDKIRDTMKGLNKKLGLAED